MHISKLVSVLTENFTLTGTIKGMKNI